jgi:hypothetical protein
MVGPMTVPIVVISVASADHAHAAALAQACSTAVQSGRCVLSGSEDEPRDPEAIATISWDGIDQGHVWVHVAVKSAPRTRWLAREIVFREEDSILERWRSAGLAVATLVGESRVEMEDVPSEPIQRVQPNRSDAGATDHATPSTRELRREWLWLDAGGLASSSPWRAGGWTRATSAPRGWPLAFSAGLDLERAVELENGVALTFAALSAGIALSVSPVRSVRLEARALGLAEYTRAAVSRPADSGGAWHAGGKVSLDFVWPSDSVASVDVGADAFRLDAGTVIESQQEPLLRLSPWGTRARLGVRFSFR